jgi:hypothetical protein
MDDSETDDFIGCQNKQAGLLDMNDETAVREKEQKAEK